MQKCPKRTKTFFHVFTVRDDHLFLITNAFYTLVDKNHVDVIKTCQACEAKEALSMDRETLLEVAHEYPHAFDPLLQDYLKSWI